ncbi:MAG: hypothetical protein AMS27_16275 [Bacteroides sp. SM23_62_1]|nr:MAG: hypothetical protein AMS27_16275 [Bacteroides sp. SM23_62_1]
MYKSIKCILTSLALIVLVASLNAQELLREEAQKAFRYLNDVRQNPASFSQEIGVNLSYVQPTPKLKWSDELAEAAEKKAMDMARRDYFDHVDPEGYGMNYWIVKAGYELPADWYSKKSSNNFESIQAGLATGKEAIMSLILDEGTDPPGHRNHLLGIEPFWSNCTDVGIGIARNPDSEYEYYTCVLVAKHDF